MPGPLARSFPTYPQRPIAEVADAPFPLGGIASAFGYDQFEHWRMMAQQNAPCLGTIKMKGFSRADLNRQPLKPDCINKKSDGCIDTHHKGRKNRLGLRFDRDQIRPTAAAVDCQSRRYFRRSVGAWHTCWLPCRKGGGAFLFV